MSSLPAAPGVVFLSYAREDAEPARRIADAWRAFFVEVGFDQSELVAWDNLRADAGFKAAAVIA
jgi:hypothetical protein